MDDKTFAWLERASRGEDADPVVANVRDGAKSVTAFKSFKPVFEKARAHTWLKVLALELAERLAEDRRRHERAHVRDPPGGVRGRLGDEEHGSRRVALRVGVFRFEEHASAGVRFVAVEIHRGHGRAPEVLQGDVRQRLGVPGGDAERQARAGRVQRHPALVPPLQVLRPLQHPLPGEQRAGRIRVGVTARLRAAGRALRPRGQRGRVRGREGRVPRGHLRRDSLGGHVAVRGTQTRGEI